MSQADQSDWEHAAKLGPVLERCRASDQRPPNVLETLLAVQCELGCVPLGVAGDIARALGVTEADVAGVLSYYPGLCTHAAGRHQVRLCMGESCIANHCKRVLAALRDQLALELGQTTPDGSFTLAPIYCVGNCAVGPSLMVDETVYGRVRPEDVRTLLEGYR
jgi:NADH:ubiquinone oxidoreductase subunit E